jgi:PAS domain S-box-containing protein
LTVVSGTAFVYPQLLWENRRVSEQIENLANPRVQQLLLAEALDTAPVLVFVADEQMRYVAVSQTACDVLGYTRSELLRLRVTDIAVAPDAGDLYDAMLQTRRQEGSTPIRAKDGRMIPFFYSARSTTVAGMHYFVSVGFVEEQLPPALRDLLSSRRRDE